MSENQNSEEQVDPKLQQELEQLDNRIEPKTNNQEESEPSVKLIEKDGQLYSFWNDLLLTMFRMLFLRKKLNWMKLTLMIWRLLQHSEL